MTSEAPWFEEANRLEAKGIVEIPGKKNNSDIMYMANAMNTWYPNDETAWCGLFVAYCLFKRGIKDTMPTNILGAKNWRDYGTEVQKENLSPGDILVFWRGTPKGAYGHVGFYVAETKDAYKVLGGNQGNTVSEAWIAKKRLITARRPRGYKGSKPIKITNSKPSTLSTNER